MRECGVLCDDSHSETGAAGLEHMIAFAAAVLDTAVICILCSAILSYIVSGKIMKQVNDPGK